MQKNTTAHNTAGSSRCLDITRLTISAVVFTLKKLQTGLSV